MFDHAEAFLHAHPFERGLWLVVAFGAGIVTWVTLPDPGDWIAVLLMCGAIACAAVALIDPARWGMLRLGLIGLSIMVGVGMSGVWAKSAMVGQPAISRPMVVLLQGTVIERREEPAKDRSRLLLKVTLAGFGKPVLVRVNLPHDKDSVRAQQGAVVRLRARLMPPAPPMLPGGYDFARTAWFGMIAATGSGISAVEIVKDSDHSTTLRGVQSALAVHIRSMLAGSPGNIAAALASGDRGAIAVSDEDAMRDAGLTHLLSISGLHVSALVGAVYWVVARLLALLPWVTLRVRVPIAAALGGALAGVAYTLLTGAEVPTVRSCIGALLVLGALALGRDPLSMRLVAVGGLVVMVFWPEAVVGPSFQMSFAAVIAIIAFHSAAPVKAFMASEHYARPVRWLRDLILLLATGIVIELALMPIALFHFHRAGIYGSLANVIAIPLTTVVTMPLIGLALLLDLVGLGAPAWWLVGKLLEFLLWIAHFVAAQPGAVTMLPPGEAWTFVVFIAGMLWLALWSGRIRLWGLFPAIGAASAMALAPTPDLLITGDGHNVGIAGEGADLLVLREGRGDYMRENLLELAGMEGDVRTLDDWPGAHCSDDFCLIALRRGGRRFMVLVAKSREYIDDMDMAAACERVDIVIADRRLPYACRPKLLKADRALLNQTGGVAVYLTSGKVRTVAETQGHQGWYRWPEPYKPRDKVPAAATSAAAMHTATPGTGHEAAKAGRPPST